MRVEGELKGWSLEPKGWCQHCVSNAGRNHVVARDTEERTEMRLNGLLNGCKVANSQFWKRLVLCCLSLSKPKQLPLSLEVLVLVLRLNLQELENKRNCRASLGDTCIALSIKVY